MNIAKTETRLLNDSEDRSPLKWFLGHDTAREILLIIGLFALYVALDLATRLLARVDSRYLDDPTLLIGAIQSQPVAYLAAGLGVGVIIWIWPKRILSPWNALEHGQVLMWLAVPLLVVLAWQGSLYEYNFLLGQTHVVDRLILVGLAAAAVARPMFLAPFAMQCRIMASQFNYPLGTRSAQNIDELLVIALLAIAAIHLLFVLTEHRQTAPVLLLLTAAIASHYFVSGRSKLLTGWAYNNDLSNLPLSGYSAGWLGQGDGQWSEQISSVVRAIGWPVLAANVVFELGWVVAVAHYRLVRLWLPAAVLFQVVVFAMTGFWFLGWILLEIGLLIVLTRAGLQKWASWNATPARATLVVAIVLFAGGTIFHPPRLDWLDAPVSYGYRIMAIGSSGAAYQVPISAFAPLVQEVSFLHLRLGPEDPASGGYGYVGSLDRYRELQTVKTFDEVESLEDATPSDQIDLARNFMMMFMDNANERGRAAWSAISAPDHFWTGSPQPSYGFDEPIEQLDVFLLTSCHFEGEPVQRTERVLTLQRSEDGMARVVFP